MDVPRNNVDKLLAGLFCEDLGSSVGIKSSSNVVMFTASSSKVKGVPATEINKQTI